MGREQRITQPLPDYYPTMYQDGYSPDEIMAAARRSMMERAARQKEDGSVFDVNIVTRVVRK